MKVLIAEDDRFTREGLADILRDEGFEVIVACNGREALALYHEQSPDFICLDVMMPDADGYDVCRRIRKSNAGVPVVFISAKAEEIDKVLGFDLGADDYIVKPFGVREVVARIRAVARRCLASRNRSDAAESFSMKDLEVYPSQLRAKRGDTVIDLSLRDVKLLEFLQANRGKALNRNAIFDYCWGEDYFPSSRTLDQHISQLRKRIERDPKQPEIIRTVHSVGYRYDG